jgi:hypothetical protein
MDRSAVIRLKEGIERRIREKKESGFSVPELEQEFLELLEALLASDEENR